MIGVNVWWVSLAPQNIPSALVSTLGNQIALHFGIKISYTTRNHSKTRLSADLHGVGLSTGCLTICKNSAIVAAEYIWK